MNFKKRVNGSWDDTPHYIHNTSTDAITTLPAVLYPTGTTATVGLKGQTLQSSTPSPTSPVMPQDTGERTGNLAPPLSEWVDGYINSSGTISTAGSDTKEKSSDYIELHDEQIITFSYPNGFPHTTATNVWRVIAFYKSNKTFLTRIGGAGDITALTASVPENAKYARLSMRNYGWTGNTMLNTGSTAIPYEPYGVKIPISSAGQTTPVYLGEVETSRKIKKVVFDGTENLASGSVIGQISYTIPQTPCISSIGLCSHYIIKSSATAPFNFVRISYASYNNGTIIWFELERDQYSTKEEQLAAFKQWLAAQYAAGTPVTVWYVLATEETGIVNEPLMRIGDYADEVSNISIPVTAGGDTLSVDTTVQPSEVSVNYKGWHPVADVHKRESGQWD